MVTQIKHNFSSFNQTGLDPLYAGIVEVNNATGSFFVYSLLFLIFVVSSYVVIRRTNDIGKGFITSLHITVLVAILVFYMGKVGGTDLLPSIALLGLIVLYIISLTGIYLFKMSNASD